MEIPVRAHIPQARRRDEGSAMIVTLLVLAVLTALATTVATVTINNLGSSLKSQQAGAALNAADAGVAQAMNNVVPGSLRCSPTCADNPWGNKDAPAAATIPGTAGQAYRVWIEAVAPFPANDPGLYRIHSTGTANGSARRLVDVDVQVTRSTVPLGIFARTINGGGNVTVDNQSVFSTGCVYSRSKLQLSGIDAAYGIPAAVHTSQIITDSQGTGQYCATTSKPIHTAGQPCNTTYKSDQDKFGDSLSGTLCASTQTTYPDYYRAQDVDGDGSTDVNGSLLRTDTALFKLFNFVQPAMSQSQLQHLRSLAKSQGNYWTTSDSKVWTSPDERNAVMYFDLNNADPKDQRLVDLNDIVGFGREPGLSANDPACPDRSLIIIIEGGNARLNSNQKLTASVFLTAGYPYGQILKANGTSNFIGTLYSDTMDLTGTADLAMDECFLGNPTPGHYALTQTSYRELDR
jgi:hypothetical protein